MEENRYPNAIEGNILLNSYPPAPGVSNFYYQQTTTLSGLKEAKRMGVTHALKIRSDMLIDDIDMLIDIMLESPNKLWFPAYINHDGGYLMDFFQFGRIDDLLRLWGFPKPTLLDLVCCKSKLIRRLADKHLNYRFENFPEKKLTNRYYEQFKEDPKYILPILKRDNIECFWLKYNFYFNKFTSKDLV